MIDESLHSVLNRHLLEADDTNWPKEGDVIFEKSGSDITVWFETGKKKPNLTIGRMTRGQLIGGHHHAKSKQDLITALTKIDSKQNWELLQSFYPRNYKKQGFGPVTPKSLTKGGKAFAVKLMAVVSDYPVEKHDVWVKSGVYSDPIKLK